MIIGTVRKEEAKTYDSHAGYHKFYIGGRVGLSAERIWYNGDRSGFGSMEVFWHENTYGDILECDEDGNRMEPGWYWWACWPGCLPDGEPTGPFACSRDALEDANPHSPEFD